jgi:hypothetical protein
MISGLGLHFCELQGLRSKFSKTLETGSQDGGFKTLNPRGLYAIGATEGVLGVSDRTIKNGRLGLDLGFD